MAGVCCYKGDIEACARKIYANWEEESFYPDRDFGIWPLLPCHGFEADGSLTPSPGCPGLIESEIFDENGRLLLREERAQRSLNELKTKYGFNQLNLAVGHLFKGGDSGLYPMQPTDLYRALFDKEKGGQWKTEEISLAVSDTLNVEKMEKLLDTKIRFHDIHLGEVAKPHPDSSVDYINLMRISELAHKYEIPLIADGYLHYDTVMNSPKEILNAYIEENGYLVTGSFPIVQDAQLPYLYNKLKVDGLAYSRYTGAIFCWWEPRKCLPDTDWGKIKESAPKGTKAIAWITGGCHQDHYTFSGRGKEFLENLEGPIVTGTILGGVFGGAGLVIGLGLGVGAAFNYVPCQHEYYDTLLCNGISYGMDGFTFYSGDILEEVYKEYRGSEVYEKYKRNNPKAWQAFSSDTCNSDPGCCEFRQVVCSLYYKRLEMYKAAARRCGILKRSVTKKSKYDHTEYCQCPTPNGGEIDCENCQKWGLTPHRPCTDTSDPYYKPVPILQASGNRHPIDMTQPSLFFNSTHEIK